MTQPLSGIIVATGSTAALSLRLTISGGRLQGHGATTAALRLTISGGRLQGQGATTAALAGVTFLALPTSSVVGHGATGATLWAVIRIPRSTDPAAATDTSLPVALPIRATDTAVGADSSIQSVPFRLSLSTDTAQGLDLSNVSKAGISAELGHGTDTGVVVIRTIVSSVDAGVGTDTSGTTRRTLILAYEWSAGYERTYP